MELLPIERLGAKVLSDTKTAHFGIYLPWITKNNKQRLWVRIIHEEDQFIQSIPNLRFELQYTTDNIGYDYWSTEVTIKKTILDADGNKPLAKSHWGEDGKYLYWYCLQDANSSQTIDWIIDPYAREFGKGKMSAFTMGYQKYIWSDNELKWKTPLLNDLIVYELMFSEFGGSIDESIKKLNYLQDLGINCIEVMPVSNVSEDVDWGYLPIGYFGVDERFGKRCDFQRFVDEAHQRGIAILIDVVYGHTAYDFCYQYVYDKIGYKENPFMGSFAKDYFGFSTDFNRKLTSDYFFTVNYQWLDVFHIDGFRYDCVPNFYIAPVSPGYSELLYKSYLTVKRMKGQDSHWQRFFNENAFNLIQCGEQLEDPIGVLHNTYTNCTWQNTTYGIASAMAKYNDSGKLESFALQGLGLEGFPQEVVHNQTNEIAKTAFQYLENHDHSRFICNFDKNLNEHDLFQQGNREQNWFKLQPYLIALFTGKGIPMLWQGQEFCENYFVPEGGMGRVRIERPLRWDYFYDPAGRKIINLVRKLVKLRKEKAQFRSDEYFFHNNYDRYQSKNILVFQRRYDNHFSLVVLNFGDYDKEVFLHFLYDGDYTEELSNTLLKGIKANTDTKVVIPSNYGCIWTLT